MPRLGNSIAERSEASPDTGFVVPRRIAGPEGMLADEAGPGEQRRAPIAWLVSDAPVPYPAATAFMEERVRAIAACEAEEAIWLLEHPPLYTAGTSARHADLIDPERFPVYAAGRGGQYTYHGPGQRVGYVMLDLNRRGRDVRAFVCGLEAWLMAALARFNLKAERRAGRVGLWVDRGGGREDKIAAIGVRLRHWVTFHGFAINVDPCLEHFSGIVPCGIAPEVSTEGGTLRMGVTSLVALGYPVTLEDVDLALMESFHL